MKLLALLLVLLSIFLGYLFFTYLGFYKNIGDKDLKEPTVKSYQIKNSKALGTIKYVSLGDSLTAGVGAGSLEKTFVYQFAEKLSLKSGQVDVVNLGIPGATTKDLIDIQLPQVIPMNPDVITLLIGINDIHGKSSSTKFGKNFNDILEQLQSQTKAKIIVLTIPYLGSSESVRPPLNLILDYQTKQFNKQIIKISQNRHIKVINLYESSYLDFSAHNEYYASDLFHPSDLGYGVWGKILKNAD